MSDAKKDIEYGVTELTGKLNDRTSEKTEDWHDDWNGRIMIDGVQYYLNARTRDNGNGEWISMKVVRVPDDKQPNQAGATEDEAKLKDPNFTL
ncbi:MAG TPA: hypothetical protein DCW74_04685 [Alteromonas australica]|uniref:Uncharacterized protein n=1 Tax=Alteromonas australica TaxID=589873 RepID=A0A350P150_9ALTE|nr:hypothetical protein [Alteromonas australica]